MSDLLLTDLRKEIRDGNVIAILGTGVSISATNNHPLANWKGLINHGITRCLDLCDHIPVTK
jgi:hypothetical protein